MNTISEMDVTDPYARIIWSADVPSVDTLLRSLDEMPLLQIVKIDRFFIDRNGWSVFGILRARELLVFDDAKIIEIPSKLQSIAEIHLGKATPWMLNCMAGGLSTGEFEPGLETTDGLKRFADVCLSAGTRPCAVTVLATKSTGVIKKEFGRTQTDQVLTYVEFLLTAGFTDVVCSPEEVSAIRSDSRFDYLELNTPGVRPVWSGNDDQTRVGTPTAAIISGADRLVIGRPITNGPGTPAENLAAIAREIEPYVNVQLETTQKELS